MIRVKSVNPYVKEIIDAIKNIREKYKNKLKVISVDELFILVGENFGFLTDIASRFMDRKYTYSDLETFDNDLKFDFTRFMTYVSDIFDCDNFAHVFKDVMDIFFGYSAIGVAYGKLYYQDNFVGYHAFNVVLVDDKGELKFLVYEPQTGNYSPCDRSYTKIGKWGYEILSLEFY